MMKRLLLMALFTFMTLATAVGSVEARENPYTLNVKGLSSEQVYEIVQGHLAGVKRSPYQAGKTEFIDAWRDKEVKAFTNTSQGTAFWAQNLPYFLKTANNAPKKHHYFFTTDRSGWNGFSSIETKRTKLQPLNEVETVKIELYDSRSMGFHHEFWLGLVPYLGSVWSVFRGFDGWAYQSTHRPENDMFMKKLQYDLQAKLNKAKALKR
ncbi:MAG: hypothetical protein HEQ32_07545 [Vampirovibrio sp.]